MTLTTRSMLYSENITRTMHGRPNKNRYLGLCRLYNFMGTYVRIMYSILSVVVGLLWYLLGILRGNNRHYIPIGIGYGGGMFTFARIEDLLIRLLPHQSPQLDYFLDDNLKF